MPAPVIKLIWNTLEGGGFGETLTTAIQGFWKTVPKQFLLPNSHD